MSILAFNISSSLRKQPTFGDATTGFPAKWRLRNKRWWHVTTQIWVVLLIGWNKFSTRLFSQARFHPFYLVPWSLNLLVQREVPGGIWEGEYPLGNFLGKIKLITAQFQFTALFLPWNSSALFTTKFQADIAVKWGVALSSRVKTFFPLHIKPFGNWK